MTSARRKRRTQGGLVLNYTAIPTSSDCDADEQAVYPAKAIQPRHRGTCVRWSIAALNSLKSLYRSFHRGEGVAPRRSSQKLFGLKTC